MAVQVRVPTILRSYTGGSKVVEGTGATLGALFTDLDATFPGLRGRLVASEGIGTGELHRFVNVYVNDEDVRFRGGLDAGLSDGDVVTILPAVAGGAASGHGQTRGCTAWRGQVGRSASPGDAASPRFVRARCAVEGK
jgi:molybdopterin converting factor small subunit